jgi:hypothetical protein
MRQTSDRSLRTGASSGVVWLVGVGLAAAAYLACASTNGAAPDPSMPGTENDSRPAQVAGYAPGVPGFEARRATAQAEIGESLRKLDTAGDSCGLACPAVSSLRVGVRHRCAVSEMKEDDKICKEARKQLLEIETRLKPSCGLCAGVADAGLGDASDP